jgi:hypothetical protein
MGIWFYHEWKRMYLATEGTENFSRFGVLGKFDSQSKLCHRILPSTTRPTKWPFYKPVKWLFIQITDTLGTSYTDF